MATAATQTDRVSVRRARRICVVMICPLFWADHAQNHGQGEIRQ